MTHLLDLAARVEAAGEDEQRELLCDAYEALAKCRAVSFEIAARFMRCIDAEAYLDAAIMLVPSGWRWSVGGAGYAGVEPPSDDPIEPEPTTTERLGATPALALAAAALRAHLEAATHD